MMAVGERARKDEKAVHSLQDYILHSGLSNEDLRVLGQSRRKAREYTRAGSTIGLCLGVGAAIFIARRRGIAFRNLRAMQRTGATVRFGDGREELITNFAPAVRPSFAKNLITFGGLGTGGYMLGSMVGNNYGEKGLKEYLDKHPDSVKRIRAWERQTVLFILRTALKNAEELDAERSERDNISHGREEEEGGFDSWPPPDNPPPEFPRSF